MEGAPDIAKTMFSFGVPLAPVYKGGGEEAAGLGGAPKRGVQLGLPILVGLPFLFRRGGKREGREQGGHKRKEKKECQFL